MYYSCQWSSYSLLLMSIASGIIKGVSAAMRAVGGDITLVRFTEGTYDEESGVFYNNETKVTIKGILSNVSRSQANDLIEAQDKNLTISAGDITFVPTTKDKVLISGISYRIIQVNVNEQNNTPLSFNLILR